LNPGGDLNDNIIENYIKILKNYAFPYCLSERIHIFSTFFFTKLLANSLDILEGQTQRDLERLRKKVYENYGNIKRWTKNTDIFEKNLLVFPINAFNHWFCIIVSHPGSLSLGKQVSESPCEIIYCDSMLQKK
jgi:sentrin-specific protease 7